MTNLKSFLFSYYKSILVFLAVLMASTIPASQAEKLGLFSIPNIDKPIHFLMYFVLTFILVYDIFRSQKKYSKMKVFAISAIITVIYGGTLEIFQALFTSSRSGDIFDFIFDSAGVITALLIWAIIKKIT